MRLVVRALAWSCWLATATLVYSFFWFRFPDAFPAPPEQCSVWLVAHLPAGQGQESTEDLLILLYSFVICTTATTLIRAIWKLARCDRHLSR
jgi:hypothetical protein